MRDDLREIVDIAERHDGAGLYRWLVDHEIGDGLPVGRPTRARVTALLEGCEPGEELGLLPPLMKPATAADVAVAATLAGCEAPLLPYVIAAVRGLSAPDFNLLGVTTTTGNVAVYVVLHGPCVAALGANAGSSCLGPGNPVNATIGRAVSLTLQVVAGAKPGTIDMATIGQPAKYGACFAEGKPPEGWPSVAAERGVGSGSSAVTVFAASAVVEIVDTYSTTGEGLLETLASAIPQPGALRAERTMLGGGEQYVLMPHEWGTMLHAQGWSKQDVQAFLMAQTMVPTERLPPSMRAQLLPEVEEQGSIPSAGGPEDFVVFVTGGPGTKGTHLISWPGGTRSSTVPVSVGG